MNAKTLVFVVCVKPVLHLLLYNLQDCTFKIKRAKSSFYQLYSKISINQRATVFLLAQIKYIYIYI